MSIASQTGDRKRTSKTNVKTTSTTRKPTLFVFFSSRRRNTRFDCDWSSDVCSSDLERAAAAAARDRPPRAGAVARARGRRAHTRSGGADDRGRGRRAHGVGGRGRLAGGERRNRETSEGAGHLARRRDAGGPEAAVEELGFLGRFGFLFTRFAACDAAE